MKALKHNSGFTLLEIVVSLFLAGLLSAGIVIMFPPSITMFNELMDSDSTRQAVISPLEMVGSEVSQMRAIYLDGAKCYQLCMEYVDPDDESHHRVIYFWKDQNLMRKKELTSAGEIDCDEGGFHFVGNLNTAKTTFEVNRELLSVNIAAEGKTNEYQLSAVFMPIIKEREILFTEGFECDTLLQGTGWTKATTQGSSTWNLVEGTQGFGSYEIAHELTAGGTNEASVEIAIDMTRYPKALLSFAYRSSVATALPANHGFFVDWWNGSAWTSGAFSHTDADDPPPTTTTPIQVDLTDFGLAAASKLRFRAISNNTLSKWYVDNIQVTSP